MKAKKQEKAIEMTATIDQADVRKQLAVVGDELAEVVAKVGDEPMAIEDEEDYRVACALLLATVVKRKKVAAWKEGFMAKVRELVAYVEGEFSPREADAAKAESYFRAAVSAYALALDNQAAALREAAAHLPARDEQKALELREKANALAPPKVPGISLRPRLAVEVLDEKKIPKAFWKLVVDEEAVEAAIKKGEKVPGAAGRLSFGVTVTPSHSKETQ